MALHVRRALGVLLACLGIASAGPTAATAAEFGITPGGLTVALLDAAGDPETRAGSHPDRLRIDFALTVEETGTSVRDLEFDLPPGFGGDPAAVPECSRDEYEEGVECPTETQVGVLSFGGFGSALPVFQLEPEPGQVAAFVSTSDVDIPFVMEMRPDELGISLRASDLPESSLSEGHVELWGVPSDHQEGAVAPRRAFLTLPAACGPFRITLRVRSRQTDAPWLSESASTAPLDGCASLAFEPTLDINLDRPFADSPSGLRMELNAGDEGGPDDLAPAPIDDVDAALPVGMTVSPGGAANLATCGDAEFGLTDSGPAVCPPRSRLGAIEIEAAALPEPLSGSIFLGAERPGQRFRLLAAVPGPGITIKLVAILRVDPESGRLTTSLADLPPIAIDRIGIELDGGRGSLLATPLTCGPAESNARFSPHGGGATVDSAVSVEVAAAAGGPCSAAIPFAPTLSLTGTTSLAGRANSISTSLSRGQGEQLPRRFFVALPPGMSAALGSTRVCPEAAAAASACPAESWLGSVRAVAGSGEAAVVLHGDTYLVGQHDGEPFGLLLRIPVVLGPFDLGVVQVRAGLGVNGRSGRITILSDPLPAAVEGVGVRFQSIELSLSRRGLIRNPTSCRPSSATASIESSLGAEALAVSAFKPTGCRGLGFRPRFRVVLRRNKQTATTLVVRARMRRADTALRAMRLSLPPAFRLGISGIDEICSRWDAAAGSCPVGSRVGTARARTSLLEEKLRGGVYVVRPRGTGQPDLAIDLSTRGVHVQIRGRTFVRHGRLTTRLAGLPDIPLSTFSMRLGSNRGGLLALKQRGCRAIRRLSVGIAARGQSGLRRRLRSPLIAAPRCRAAGSAGTSGRGKLVREPLR